MYPLLTLAQEVCSRKKLKASDLHFIIADNNADFKYFESSELYKQFTYSEYSVAKLRRYFSWQNFLDFFIFLKNIIQSFFFLLFNRPEKIFSKGGFVSLPFGISAFLLRIPFYLHETDSVMGLSNKILSKFAHKVFTGFPVKNVDISTNNKYIFVGNPVRAEFFVDFDKIKQTPRDTLNFLIFGGSQGAHALNEWARTFFDISKNTELLHVLEYIKKNIKVLIISGRGKSNSDVIKKINLNNKNYKHKYQLTIEEVEFLSSDFVEIIHKSDIVLTRAGGSVAELAASAKCTILVPLPTSANNHQQKNADYFASKNAVLGVRESELYSDKTYKDILNLLKSEEMQKSFTFELSKFSKPNVAGNILKYL